MYFMQHWVYNIGITYYLDRPIVFLLNLRNTISAHAFYTSYIYIHASGLGGIRMQSDGIASHVYSWIFCMTLHHMCILHTSAGVKIKVMHKALWVFLYNSLFFYGALSLSATIFVSQCVCVRVRAYDIYLVD